MSTMLREDLITTRKPHKCFGCCHEYPAGTAMISFAVVDGGRVFGGYLCEVCKAYAIRRFEYGDEYGEGELYNCDPEGWEEIKKELEDDHANG